MKPFFVYLLRCSDGSYYVGQTEDMDARLQQHGDGLIGYTATRKPIELLWQGEFETREGAIAFEQRIKGWSRAKKDALARGDWPAIQQLARSRTGPSSRPVRPELVEGQDGAPASMASRLRRAQPERVEGAVMGVSTVRPELVEGQDAAQASIASRLRQAQPERVGGKPMGEAP